MTTTATTKRERRMCETSLQSASCEAPAGYGIGLGGGYADGEGSTRLSCYACGLPSCRMCSKVRLWKGARGVVRARICNDCAGRYQHEEAIA